MGKRKKVNPVIESKVEVKAPVAKVETVVKEVSKTEFLNPFDAGVVYTAFLEQVKKTKKTVAEYCKGNLSKEEMQFLEKELKLIKK